MREHTVSVQQTAEQEIQLLRRAVEELSVLNEVATAISGARDLQAILQILVERAMRAVGAQQGVITLVAENTQDPMKTLVRTMTQSEPHPALRPDQRVLGWMQRHQKPLFIDDPAHDPQFSDVAWDPSVRSVLSVPLSVRKQLVGLLTVYNKKGEPAFRPEDGRLLSIIAAQSAQVVENARLADERDRILHIFGQYTAPSVVEELLRAGTGLESRLRRVSVLFFDIRNFTTFAEQARPEAVVDYLNRLFDATIERVNRHHGIVHQLLGDGFMALFGAPLSHGNDSRNAVDAAREILDWIRTATAEGTIPPTRVGIGVHAGEVVVGLVGSAIHKEYTVTGDVVNVAARIEQLTKQFDANLLVSEAVRAELRDDGVEAQPIGAIAVRGRKEPIRLFRLA